MKIVRDGIPRAHAHNEYHVVEGRELATMLRLKLMEEAGEVVGARNVEEIRHELADVLEVVYAIADHYRIDRSHLLQTRIKKHKALGGFEGGWVMNSFDGGDS